METKVTIVTTITDNSQCAIIAGILAELARNEMDYHAKYEPAKQERGAQDNGR
jgi:hypothetical protein